MSDTHQTPTSQEQGRWPVLIRLIGYCDLRDKPHGMEWVVRLPEPVLLRSIPSQETMLSAAVALGIYPSGMQGAVEGRCDPVYEYVTQPEIPIVGFGR